MRSSWTGPLIAVSMIGTAACGKLVYRPAQLSDAGRGVVLAMHTHAGADCTWVADVEARNIHDDPKYMRYKLRNDTAKQGGNVVKVDSWSPRAYASGRGFKCPEATLRRIATAEPIIAGDTPAPAQEAAADPAVTADPPGAADAAVDSLPPPSVVAPSAAEPDELPPAPPPPSSVGE